MSIVASRRLVEGFAMLQGWVNCRPAGNPSDPCIDESVVPAQNVVGVNGGCHVASHRKEECSRKEVVYDGTATAIAGRCVGPRGRAHTQDAEADCGRIKGLEDFNARLGSAEKVVTLDVGVLVGKDVLEIVRIPGVTLPIGVGSLLVVPNGLVIALPAGAPDTNIVFDAEPTGHQHGSHFGRQAEVECICVGTKVLDVAGLVRARRKVVWREDLARSGIDTELAGSRNDKWENKRYDRQDHVDDITAEGGMVPDHCS